MKKVIVANIGGKSFSIDDDAFVRLENYLNNFRATIENSQDADEVMEDIEMRIAEIFSEQLRNEMQTVNCVMVDHVATQLGMPEKSSNTEEPKTKQTNHTTYERLRHRLYRDIDNKMIGGVCSGIAAYMNIDVVIVRLVTFLALIFGGLSFWAYIILWIVVPAARTVSEKLEMHGKPVTAENIKNLR